MKYVAAEYILHQSSVLQIIDLLTRKQGLTWSVTAADLSAGRSRKEMYVRKLILLDNPNVTRQ